MFEARHSASRRTLRELKASDWLPADFVLQVVNAALGGSALIASGRLRHGRHAILYLFLHLGFALGAALLARYDARVASGSTRHPRARAIIRFAHHWLPVGFVLAVYFELGLLIPELHPFDDHRYDRALQAIDVWLVGDPIAVIGQLARPALSDLLTACYASYYLFPFALPSLLYARGALAEFDRVAIILVVAFMLSYVGYCVVPALGPHALFDGHRPAALAGYGLAGHVYALLCRVPHEPPDAFPSGHTLFAVLVPALAWRYSRALSIVLAPLGLGIIVATVYLRFHYITDVVAALALAPLACMLGDLIAHRFSRRVRTCQMSSARGHWFVRD